MFTDKEDDDEVGEDGHQEVDDEDGGDQEGEVSDDELLPDIDSTEPSEKKPRKERKVWNWVDGDLEPKEMPDNVVKPKGMEGCRFAVEYFMKMFGKETFNLLLEQTNIYRTQINKKIAYIEMSELRKAIGIFMYMSVVSLPSTRHYWKKSMGITTVSKVMPRDRFDEIKKCLHLSNNLLQKKKDEPGYDKLFKVRKLLDLLNKNFKACADTEEIMSVDEQMIPYKGNLMLKVYMKNKPSKWGIKIWALAGQSGYIHSFNVFGDNLINTEGELGIGASGQTVLNLASDLPEGTEVFFDNYFASPGLLLELK